MEKAFPGIGGFDDNGTPRPGTQGQDRKHNLLPGIRGHSPLVFDHFNAQSQGENVGQQAESIQQLAKLQDSNDLVPTAPRHHPLTQPATSAYLSLLPSNLVARRLHRREDHLLVKARLPTQALECQIVPVPWR